MRFVVKEQSYETLIASGQFKYVLDSEATGAVEMWRLSAATTGYEVVRVDLDARSAPSGHSYLYHLVRQSNGRPERLSYRFWGDGLTIEGTLLFAETSVTGTRRVNGQTVSEDLDIDAGTGFWFPSAVGLGLAANSGSGPAVILNNEIGGQDSLALQQITQDVTRQKTAETEMAVAGKMVKTTAWQIEWQGQTRFVLTDENGWPLKMERDDGLTAVETRYIWY